MRLFEWLKGRRITAVPEDDNPHAIPVVAPNGNMILPLGAIVVPEPKYPEAERIAASLREFPEDWQMNPAGHYLKHIPTGFLLWCGNEERGVGEWDGHKRIPYSEPEQKIIWKALAPLAVMRPRQFGALPKVRIHGARGTFWCIADGHPWAGAGNSPADAYRAWSRAVSIQARKDVNPEEYLHVWSAAL
ncbi:hypothetical protein AB4P95_20165 [Pseudomonas sp. A1437]|uniref:hypothetical protein n=1 Tax=unclassified Pseudomonas TaxID=196821 RepID=UPI003784DCAC